MWPFNRRRPSRTAVLAPIPDDEGLNRAVVAAQSKAYTGLHVDYASALLAHRSSGVAGDNGREARAHCAVASFLHAARPAAKADPRA